MAENVTSYYSNQKMQVKQKPLEQRKLQRGIIHHKIAKNYDNGQTYKKWG